MRNLWIVRPIGVMCAAGGVGGAAGGADGGEVGSPAWWMPSARPAPLTPSVHSRPGVRPHIRHVGAFTPHDETTTSNTDCSAPASRKVITQSTRFIHPYSWSQPTKTSTFPHQQAEKSSQNQRVLSFLHVGSHHLQHRLFRTSKPKSHHKTNTFCPLTHAFCPLTRQQRGGAAQTKSARPHHQAYRLSARPRAP